MQQLVPERATGLDLGSGPAVKLGKSAGGCPGHRQCLMRCEEASTFRKSQVARRISNLPALAARSGLKKLSAQPRLVVSPCCTSLALPHGVTWTGLQHMQAPRIAR